jgi:ketosteroid isomerase-like protein
MKTYLYTIAIILLFAQCNNQPDLQRVKQEVVDAEKAFEKMTAEKGTAEAFYFFAADSAVIKRGDGELIKGRENIKKYYEDQVGGEATVNWAPDYVDVSASGDLAYTYGKYVWRVKNDTVTNEFKGIFHTVWKRQPDNSWKYVWD